MGLARNALLWVSENRKLRSSLPRYPFIRRAVTRFMPGETLPEATQAAIQLQPKKSIPSSRIWAKTFLIGMKQIRLQNIISMHWKQFIS